MNSIILKSLFLGKASGFSSRIALSTTHAAYSYEEIFKEIDLLCQKFPVQQGETVAVCLSNSPELLFVILALLKQGARIVLIEKNDRLNGDLARILSVENPGIFINDDSLTGNDRKKDGQPQDDGFTISGFSKRIGFGLYGQGHAERIDISAASVLEGFATLTKLISPGQNEKYFITGQLSLLSLVIESMWCLFNGIPILFYPHGSGDIQTLVPDNEQFVMDFSLFFFGNSIDDPDREDGGYDLLMKSAAHADKHGYSAVWTPERHFSEFGGKFPNPSILGAALAVRTEKVQIRTGSIVAPLHHVVRIAEDWAVIDNLSAGRGALSFASGWQCNDFIFYPDRYAKRHEVMLQQLDDLRKLWAGEEMEFDNGVGVKIPIRIYPRPVQQEIPIWITVSGKTETFTDAGKAGANILTHLLWQDPTDLIEKIQVYRDSLREHGFDPRSRTVSVMLHTFVGQDIAEVRRKVEKPLKEYIRSSLHLIETMTATVKDTKGNNAIGRYGKNDEVMPEHLKEQLLEIAFERFFTSASLLGDPAHCRDIIKKLRSYGVDELACLIDFGVDTESILHGLEQLNTLKNEYSERTVKRHPGALILRTDRRTLKDMTAQSPAVTSHFRKILAGTDEQTAEDALHVKDLLLLSYHPQEPAKLISGRLDSRFEEQRSRLYELNLAQASQKILEDF